MVEEEAAWLQCGCSVTAAIVEVTVEIEVIVERVKLIVLETK